MTILLLFVLFMVGATALVLYLQPKQIMEKVTTHYLYKVDDLESIKSVTLEQSEMKQRFDLLTEKFPTNDGIVESSSWVFQDKLHAVDPNQFGGATVILAAPEAYSLIGDNVENMEQYGFNDSQLTITLHFDNNPENNLIYYLGGASPAGDFVYANLKDSKKVYSVVQQWKLVFSKFLTQRPYLIFLNISLETDAPSDLTEINITRNENTTNIKKENENWITQEKTVNPTLISNLRQPLNNQKVFRKIQRHFGPIKYGLGTKERTTIEFKQGKRSTIINLGAIVMDNQYQYAEIVDDPEENLYLISTSFGKKFLELIR